MRSTKEIRREKAWEIARGWEHVERNASNEAQVRKVMSEILQRNTGQPLRTPTVREWFVEWLQSKAEGTKDRYQAVASDFFEYLGERADRALKDVMPRDVEGYVNRMKGAKFSDKTIALHLQALKSAFNHARRMQVIDASPADPITFEVKDELEREMFSEAEGKALIDAAEGEWKTLLRIGYYTGLRLMTAATLRWGSQDTVQQRGGNCVDLAASLIMAPKPGKRGKYALIPIHEHLLPFLKECADGSSADGYVMPKLASGESGGKRGLSRQFKAIAKKANVDLHEITRPNGHKFCLRSFHSLRRGFVSGLANKGVTPERRRAITGHKTEREHGRYTHHEIQVLREEINKLPPIPE
jgi:integrase